MKKNSYLLILALCIISTNVFAQTSFSCKYREYCTWSDYYQKFKNCKGYEDASLFVMNKSETMFTHTTNSIKSTYYVKSKQYDKEHDVFTYSVTSDVGNKYYYVFDLNNKEIRILAKRNGTTTLVRFYVKAIF